MEHIINCYFISNIGVTGFGIKRQLVRVWKNSTTARVELVIIYQYIICIYHYFLRICVVTRAYILCDILSYIANLYYDNIIQN